MHFCHYILHHLILIFLLHPNLYRFIASLAKEQAGCFSQSLCGKPAQALPLRPNTGELCPVNLSTRLTLPFLLVMQVPLWNRRLNV